MKILVIGSGGREHALAWKLAQSPRVQNVIVAPGNPGTLGEPNCENAMANTVEQWVALAKNEKVGMAVVGPEAPPADASDPLGDFEDETERGLAAVIAKRTGIAPIVVLDVLRFWVRDRDGEPFMRDLDLSEYHPRERVKHALRAAVRIASLDHFGAPLLPWTPDYTVVPPSKSEKAP